MSDFSFDAYALDDLDATGDPHPLEIARDLIATGKPRSALEVLSLHHKTLADDPEYLMLCGEAWRAAGDTMRAQQALLGAVRLAPRDVRPLQLLGDLLVERGELDRAQRVFDKARDLVPSETGADEALEPSDGEIGEDLIAFAEREERTRQAPVDPRHVWIALAVIGGVALLVLAIVLVTTSEPGTEPAVAAAPSPEETVVEPAPEVEAPVPMATAEAPSEPTAPPKAPAPAPEPTPPSLNDKPASGSPAKSKPTAQARTPKKPKPAAPAPTVDKSVIAVQPVPADLEAQLRSLRDPKKLTARADELYARGQTQVAAKYYRRALELDPDYAPALVGIGRGLLRAEKYSEAMGNATRALQLARGVDARPGLEAEALYQMGRVHFERGERDAARHLLRQSTSLRGTPAATWFYLGEALSRDNSPAARDAYEKYLELMPKGHLSDRAYKAIQ